MSILDDVVRQFLLTLWNVYAFFVTYANASGFDGSTQTNVPVLERPLLDRWVLSQLDATVGAARESLEAYDATGAGRRIARFVDDLSNWYVRRARRRFWDPDGAGGTDTVAAFLTLHECLVTVAQLLAPFTPVLAEALWRNLAAERDGLPDSVHLSDYPSPLDRSEAVLDEAMEGARRIVEIGRRVRTETRVRVRQPLQEAVVHYPGDQASLLPLLPLIAEELNVKEVLFVESAERFGRWHAKPRFKTLGPRLGPLVKDVASALEGLDPETAATLARGGSVTLRDIGSEPIELSADDVDLTQETLEGWGVATEGGLTVALELELTTALRREGLARELVRAVQEARRAAGLEVSDRIALGLAVEGDLVDALSHHRDWIAAETLATDLQDGAVEDPTYRQVVDVDGSRVEVTLRRA
jgi:isoleucyl-tRNA synthetase